MQINIIIGDKHQIYREGLIKLLKQAKNITVTEQAENMEDLVSKVQMLNPDLILIDTKLSDDIGCIVSGIQKINNNNPLCRIIALALHADGKDIRAVIKAGVSGFISKKSNYHQLYDSIIQVYSGKYYFCDETLNILVKNCAIQG